MKFWKLPVLIISVVALPAAHAQDSTPDLLNWNAKGNDYIATCEHGKNSFDSGACLGYLQGVMTASTVLEENPDFCVPDGVTLGQAASVVRTFIDEHPERWHHGVVLLMHEALAKAFPITRTCNWKDTK